jgi:MICOS complex subunit MIC19
MGNSPSTANDSTKHVFSASTPINFSPDLIDSLQSTPETDSTRARTLDLHIQQRVAEELEKIQRKQNELLESARQGITREGSSETGGESGSGSGSIAVSAKDLLPSAITGEDSEEAKRKAQTSQKVQAEIEKLRSTLAQRKVLRDLPKEVESARNDVISCLRINDRRPLDCWKEVEVFKRSVKTMEDEFVSKVL